MAVILRVSARDLSSNKSGSQISIGLVSGLSQSLCHHLGWQVAAVPMSLASEEVTGFYTVFPWVPTATLTDVWFQELIYTA